MAAPGSGADDDPQREARAYNDNIYLMVSAPYLLLGVFGFFVYRGFKKLRQFDLLQEALQQPPGPETAGPSSNGQVDRLKQN